MGMYNEQFMNDSIKKMAEWQTQALEPSRKLGESAAQTYEKFMHLNYEVMGDVNTFSISQAHLLANATEPKAYFESLQTALSAYGDTLSERVSEYSDLTSELLHKAQEATLSASKVAKSKPETKTPPKKAA
ncbi:MAG: phasin family protein [Gammaproteobacteria bacterium]|nr:phasin family protein [Gammaproteobacteria bacterium]